MKDTIQQINVDAASIVQLYWTKDEPLGTLEFDALRGIVFTDAISARTTVVRRPNLNWAVPEGVDLITLTYRTRPIAPDDEPEADIVDGWFTGEVDSVGKHTFQPLRQPHQLYLFADEIIDREVL